MKGDKDIELRVTSDGSPTLFCSEIDECYHSMHGARTESEHIFLRHGLDLVRGESVRVLEVGMGIGLNMLLTALHPGRARVIYHAVEKYPIDTELVESVMGKLSDTEFELMHRIHTLPWGAEALLMPDMEILKLHGDMLDVSLEGGYNVVYFDAFSPEKQPEMWSEQMFSKCYNLMEPGGVLSTYCSKGIVKEALRNAGFEVKRYQGPPGKRHIVVAYKR